jgi:hypothetical protein
MTLAMNVYNAVKLHNKSDDWSELAKQNPDMSEVFTWVSRLRDA